MLFGIGKARLVPEWAHASDWNWCPFRCGPQSNPDGNGQSAAEEATMVLRCCRCNSRCWILLAGSTADPKLRSADDGTTLAETGISMYAREMETLILDFVGSLVELVERDVARRAQHAIASVSVSRGAVRKKRQVPLSMTSAPSVVASTVHRAPTVTPKLLRARKLQGKYMAAVRGLKPEDQKRVKKLTSEKGAAAGLLLARSLGQGTVLPPRTKRSSAVRQTGRPT